jgi:hypothetical protein
VTPAERAARASRGGGREGSNEISPVAVAALMARHGSSRASLGPAAARRAAAALIRCMDRRDTAGADAFMARLSRGRDLDAVMVWVWWIEADRVARRRVYQASPAWHLEREVPEQLHAVPAVPALAVRRRGRPVGARTAAGRVQSHGTRAAWRRHRYHGELQCPVCLTGDGERARKAAQRAAAGALRAA